MKERRKKRRKKKMKRRRRRSKWRQTSDEKQSVFKQVHMPALTADQGFQPSFGVLAILGLCALSVVRHLQHLCRHRGEQRTCLCPPSRLGQQTEQTCLNRTDLS